MVNPLACAAGAAYLTATGQPAAAPAAAGGFSSAAAATNSTSGGGGAAAFAGTFRELLLAPRHWLATWRLNCLLVAWHAAASGGAREYALEDKAPFLLEAERLGLPGAPFVKAARVFVKHRGVEGGQVGAARPGLGGCGRARAPPGRNRLYTLRLRHTNLRIISKPNFRTHRAYTCTTTSRPEATGSSQRRSQTRPASRACCRGTPPSRRSGELFGAFRSCARVRGRARMSAVVCVRVSKMARGRTAALEEGSGLQAAVQLDH